MKTTFTILTLVIMATGHVQAQSRQIFQCLSDSREDLIGTVGLSTISNGRYLAEIKLESSMLPKVYIGRFEFKHGQGEWYYGQGHMTNNSRIALGIFTNNSSKGFQLDLSGFVAPIRWFHGIGLNCVPTQVR